MSESGWTTSRKKCDGAAEERSPSSEFSLTPLYSVLEEAGCSRSSVAAEWCTGSTEVSVACSRSNFSKLIVLVRHRRRRDGQWVWFPGWGQGWVDQGEEHPRLICESGESRELIEGTPLRYWPPCEK